MLDPLDPLTYELCFPGGLTGETEISCPHCKTLLTVPVNDPTDEESYQCCKCQKGFVVDWASGQVTTPANVTISLAFEDKNKDARQ
jgi:DNA-directed RNA polymerase subunit RPC12/RpoP